MKNSQLCTSKILVCVFLVAVIILNSFTAYAYFETADYNYDKVLFIADTQGISEIMAHNDIDNISKYIDFMDYEKVSIKMDVISRYSAVAFPYGDKFRDEIFTAYQSGCIVYLYGSLTISEYKESINLNEYALDMYLYNEDDLPIEKVKQFFDKEYEETEVFNIISYSANALLCKVQNAEDRIPSTYAYLTPIRDNYSKIVISAKSNTIFRSSYDINFSFGPNDQFSVSMDYFLYRNSDENDPIHDYYAVKTRTWVNHGSTAKTKSIQTKYELANDSDNLLETGPGSHSNIGSLNVSIGYGESGPSASIGYTLDLSDSHPTIKRTENFTSDTVEWTMTPRTILPQSIDEASLVCCATWSSLSNERLLGVDIFVNGEIGIEIGNYQYPLALGYTKVPVRFLKNGA